MSNSPSPTRRLAAIMFSDMCGFSRLMGKDETGTMKMLARHDQIVNEVIPTFGGTIIKRMGDGVMTEFQSAVSAVECAMALQQKLHDENAAAPEKERFQVRIGVHLGDIMVLENNDILGDGVNVASRIEPLATPGGICISQDVLNLIHNKLEIQTLSIGPQQLKNISRQIEIYRVLVAAADREGGPPHGTVSPASSRKELRPSPPPSGVPWKKVGVGLLILLLVAVSSFYFIRNRKQKRLWKTTLEIEALVKEKKGKEALSLIDEHQKTVLPGSAHAERREKAREAALDCIEEQAIVQRYSSFLQRVQEKDFEGAGKFFEPESLGALGRENVVNRLRMARGLAMLGSITPEDFRLTRVQLLEKRTEARFFAELHDRKKDQWRPLPLGRMVKVEGTWLFLAEKHREPQRPRTQEGQNQRRGLFPRRPFRQKSP